MSDQIECVLAGPKGGKHAVLAALKKNGVSVPAEGKRSLNPSHHLPREKGDAWISCLVELLDPPEGSLAPVEKALSGVKGWGLRLHHRKRAVSRPADPLADIRRRLDKLEGKR